MSSNDPSAVLSYDEIEAIRLDAIEEAEEGRKEAAWQKVQPLRSAQALQREAAKALVWIVYKQGLDREAAIDVLSAVAQSHGQDSELLSAVGDCLTDAGSRC